MAHNNTHRRILASQDHNPKTSISMDPTLKKQPKPTPFTSKSALQLSCLDSSLSTNKHSTTFEESDAHVLRFLKSPNNIATDNNNNNTSNHKILKSNSKDSSGHSSNSLNNHLKPKSWTSSSVLDSSCTPLTKSKSQHGNSTMVKVKKVPHSKGNKEFNKEVDVKRGCVNLSKSQEIERFKEFDEIKKQSLLALPLKNVGRRKSFCSSKIELGDFFSCSGVKVVSVDMPPFMQIHAVNCARKTHDSLEKFTSKALAFTLKKEFDEVYGPAWHCIVGTSFGSFVTHSVGGFMYFSMDHKLHVLLFKTTVQKAESS
ncbi:hypothetical protein T459_17745 [Capsicum annuum]|uniref:Uncharacterized protein n=1 Tax=Capsicum annuum TaxID=4072 RepID=A0A2G2ZCG4_CAPAN|nr:uncharacterized protein LOC107875931 [Capsicum annuum]PHT79693.1 hypothetical protein T459_17745 [Capsicum annuum]